MGRRITRESGFTLVEILSVLVVVGLMSSVVILSMPQPKSTLDKEAERLVIELNALAQDGLISGSVNAVGFSEGGYALYRFENSDWAEQASREWRESYHMTFSRNSAKLELPKNLEPVILFQPTGLSTPFELTLSNGDQNYVIESRGDGRVNLVKSIQ